MRFAPTRFRPVFGRVLAGVIVAIATVGVVGFLVVSPADALRFGPALALLAVGTVATFWLPSLEVAEAGVTVRNVFRTIEIPWGAIRLVDTRFALTFDTDEGRVSVWASPAPNRYASASATARGAGRAAGPGGFAPRPGDLLETDSGAAAFVIRQHLEDLRADGRLEAADGPLRRRTHVATIVTLAVLTVATALGLAL